MGAFSNMDYELQNSEAAVSDAFTEDDAMDMPQTAPVEPATASSPTAAPTPAAAASEPATAPNTQSEDEARRAHEASEAKRKAEWDAKQAEKRRAEQAALERLDAMGPAELLKAAAKRVSADTEKLTRRNMKESVAEFIQTKCILVGIRCPSNMTVTSSGACLTAPAALHSPTAATISLR